MRMAYNIFTKSLVYRDNYTTGQITEKVNDLLEENHPHVGLLPPNTTVLLQPMDISVSKPVKSFLKYKFSQWYAKQLLQHFEDQSHVPLSDISLEPIDMSMAVMKNISAKWFVKTAEYIADNPQFIVNGFIKAGICRALGGITSDDELDDLLHMMDLDHQFSAESESDSSDDLFAAADNTETITIDNSDSNEEP